MKETVKYLAKYMIIGATVLGSFAIMSSREILKKRMTSTDLDWYDTAHVASVTLDDAETFRMFNKSDSVQWYKVTLKNVPTDTVVIPLSPMAWSPFVIRKVISYAGNSDTVIYYAK